MIRSRLVRTALSRSRSYSCDVSLFIGGPISSAIRTTSFFLSTLALDDSPSSSNNNNHNEHSSSSSNDDDNNNSSNGSILLKRYKNMSKQKEGSVFQVDPHQIRALEALERLRRELLATPPPPNAPPTQLNQQQQQSKGFFGGWLLRGGGATAVSSSWSSSKTKTPKGVYLHGGVGCGKTFLMDLFYDEMQASSKKTSSSSDASTGSCWTLQKIHFHKFMLRVHNEMHLARKQNNHQQQQQQQQSDGILPSIVASTLQHGRVLCLDEFQVTDVADALILQRLFEGLWQAGCVVVATSNRPPDELYLNGLQRDRFLPFIDVLKQNCQVVSMEESQTDYRLVQKDKTGTTRHVYFLGKESRADFNELFYELAGNGNAVAPTSLQTQGRQVTIPLAVMAKCMARFSFEDLCQKALGAADYLVIGQTFHTVFVEKIPVLTLNEINWVRRFISFVDCMYECNVKLILQAKTPPELIFQPGSTTGEYDEVFAFDRTISRLQEMQSQNYLRKKWVRRTESTKKRKTTLVLEPICP